MGAASQQSDLRLTFCAREAEHLLLVVVVVVVVRAAIGGDAYLRLPSIVTGAHNIFESRSRRKCSACACFLRRAVQKDSIIVAIAIPVANSLWLVANDREPNECMARSEYDMRRGGRIVDAREPYPSGPRARFCIKSPR